MTLPPDPDDLKPYYNPATRDDAPDEDDLVTLVDEIEPYYNPATQTFAADDEDEDEDD